MIEEEENMEDKRMEEKCMEKGNMRQEKLEKEGMKQGGTDKVCFRYVCPRYPQCQRARGKGCCIDYPEHEEELVGEGDCRAEDGFPLFAGER